MAVRILLTNARALTRTLNAANVNAVSRVWLATAAQKSLVEETRGETETDPCQETDPYVGEKDPFQKDTEAPIKDITINEVCSGVLDGKLILIDVRNPQELEETGRIGHSLNIPLSELAEAFSLPEDQFKKRYNLPKPDETQDNLVLYCKSGARALKGCELLADEGYTKVKRYPGSMTEWQMTLLGLQHLSKFLPETDSS